MERLGEVRGELNGLKDAVQLLTKTHSDANLSLQNRLHSVEMRVFVGLGMALLAGFLVPLLFRYIPPPDGDEDSAGRRNDSLLCLYGRCEVATRHLL